MSVLSVVLLFFRQVMRSWRYRTDTAQMRLQSITSTRISYVCMPLCMPHQHVVAVVCHVNQVPCALQGWHQVQGEGRV